MMKRIAMMQAINQGKPAPERGPCRKRAKAYAIIQAAGRRAEPN
jgi:hypothetical protein